MGKTTTILLTVYIVLFILSVGLIAYELFGEKWGFYFLLFTIGVFIAIQFAHEASVKKVEEKYKKKKEDLEQKEREKDPIYKLASSISENMTKHPEDYF